LCAALELCHHEAHASCAALELCHNEARASRAVMCRCAPAPDPTAF